MITNINLLKHIAKLIMTLDASKLVNGQKIRVELSKVKDRLPSSLVRHLSSQPVGTLVGFKMVDGNRFGLVLQLSDGTRSWFFEEELTEYVEVI